MIVDGRPEADKEMADVLREHAQAAYSMGLIPYVEFTARWCPGCEAIRKSLRDENALMVDAFQGVYLIRMDVDTWYPDEWGDDVFKFEFIPIIFRVDAEGKPTGAKIGGDAWGENIPENMAPPLKEFFEDQRRKP